MRIRRKDQEEVAIDMSPMIDMVFLLLIFFIVASAIVKVELVQIEVPSALYAKVPEDETGRFTITVTDDGNLYVSPTQEQVTIDGLKDRVGRELETDQELRILIRADRLVKYHYNEEIMEACAEVRANDMIFSAFEE